MNDPIFRIPDDFRVESKTVAQAARSWDVEPESDHRKLIELIDGGRGLRIYVGDTEPDLSHPAFADLDIEFQLFTRVDRRRRLNSHCTHVLDTVARLLPRAKYFVGGVLNRRGFGDSQSILNGAKWAADNGCELLNESLGSSEPYAPKRDFLANFRGLLFAASGNSGGRMGYPALHGIELNTIPVGSINRALESSNFTSFGPELLLLAPGENITAAVPGGGYGVLSGTSMATPNAVGLVGAMLSAMHANGKSQATAADALQLITDTAVDIGQPGRDDRTGYGYLTMSRTLRAVETFLDTYTL